MVPRPQQPGSRPRHTQLDQVGPGHLQRTSEYEGSGFFGFRVQGFLPRVPLEELGVCRVSGGPEA